MRCNSCDSTTINGIFSHEIGCPDSWMQLTNCKNCNYEFMPEHKTEFCSQSCYNDYIGFPELDDFELLPDSNDLE